VLNVHHELRDDGRQCERGEEQPPADQKASRRHLPLHLAAS
jgi:hypothetical protein